MYLKKLLRNKFFVVSLFLFITSLFFYKFVVYGYIPFPGDLLIAEYSPWKFESYLGYNPGSYPNKAQYFDVIRQLYPWKELVIEQIKSGSIPLWNSHNFSGTPLLANNQSGVFYPINIVFFLINFVNGWGLYIYLQPFLALCFTYLYLRSLSISKIASIFGSIAFSFSLYMTVFLEYGNIGHTFIWLPLILFGIEKSIRKINLYSLLIVLGIVSSGFAGHLQIFSYVLVFSFVYLFFRILEDRKNTVQLLWLTILFVLSIGILSVQLIPTLELISFSARVSHDYDSFVSNLLLQPVQALLLIMPDLFGNPVTRNYILTDSYPGNAMYIGMSAIFFSFYSIYLKKNRLVVFFIASSFVLLGLILRWPFTELLYSFNIPFISSSSPSNALFLFTFSASVLSAYGFDKFFKFEKLKNHFPILIFSTILLAIWALKIFFNFQVSTNNFILSNGLFILVVLLVLLWHYFRQKIFSYLFVLLLIFDLFFFFQRFNPFVSKELVYPPSNFSHVSSIAQKERIYGYGSSHIEPNFQTQLKTFSVEGYDPLYVSAYGKLINSSIDGKLKEFDNTTRSNAMLVSSYGGDDFTKEYYRQKIMDLMGIRYVYDRSESGSSEQTFPLNYFSEVLNTNGWKLYENKNASERYFLVNNYLSYSSDKDFEDKFYSKDFDVNKSVLLNTNNNFELDKNASGSIKLVYNSPNLSKYEANTTSPMILFVSDVYYPGWVAKVNNVESSIVKANYAFRAVLIPSGESSIEFAYKPKSFYIGFSITIISILGLVVYLFLIKYAVYKKT